MKKLIFYIVLLVISIFIYFNLSNIKDLDILVKEPKTFPQKEYLDKLEEMQIQ